jgi:nucleotide-binding universal stress UspA family protein
MSELNKPIVIPWDFSEKAEFALEHAFLYADLMDVDIALVHIVKKESEIPDATKKLNDKIETVKTKIKNKIVAIAREGSIFTSITEIIDEFEASLAIMGTHGMKGMQKITGSWALKVITGSKCPFIVVQDKPFSDKIDNLIVPIDFKLENKEKLVWTNFLAQFLHAKFHLCYVDSSDLFVKKQTKANITVATKYMTDRNIDFDIKKLEGKGGLPQQTLDYAKEINSSLIMIMTTKNIRLQDYMLGADEQKIIANEYKLTVMCINPREDLRKYGGFS